jgi:ribose transport system permease protein
VKTVHSISGLLLKHISIILALGVCVYFALSSPKFMEPGNWVNILIQSSSAGIVAIGMTFVLLVAGIDLSVGAVMYLGAAVAAKMVLGGINLGWAILAILAISLGFGLINGLLITRLRLIPFIVTLATLYLARGLGLWLTETRAMNLPESFLAIGSSRFLGIPTPILIFLLVLLGAHLLLSQTSFGRQLYAIGSDVEAARKAGINTNSRLLAAYLICGLLAGLGGMVSVAQLGAVSPTFGFQREFAAIAAAVLGGTSLFGGRGNVLPGTLLGAVLIQTIENGLVIVNADPYIYPMVTGGIMFLAVMLDSLRAIQMQQLTQRKIRLEGAE